MPQSKLDKFRELGVDYKTEFQRNVRILQAAVDSFKSIYHADCKGLDLSSPKFEEMYFIRHRMREILVSATDDMARYWLYHNIAKESELYHNKESGKAFALSPPTRAAFFIKWVTNFKPCKLDEYVTPLSKSNSNSGDLLLSCRFEYASEILAIFVASTIMGLQDKNGRVCLLSTLLSQTELESFLYQLKYRINHQDAFYSFFNRLYYSNPASR
jgi:hypothetical protein